MNDAERKKLAAYIHKSVVLYYWKNVLSPIKDVAMVATKYKKVTGLNEEIIWGPKI